MMWSGLEPSEGEVYYGHYIAVLFWLALREISEKLEKGVVSSPQTQIC